jgi:cell division protein FtsQ
MPVSNKFTPRVAVATGEIMDNGKYAGPIEHDPLKELFEMAGFIYHDPFMQPLVDQVIVTAGSRFELIPKIDNHSIVWGDAQNHRQKKRKLQLFYKDGIKKAGWKSYRQVDLRFKDQIVCKKR